MVSDGNSIVPCSGKWKETYRDKCSNTISKWFSNATNYIMLLGAYTIPSKSDTTFYKRTPKMHTFDT